MFAVLQKILMNFIVYIFIPNVVMCFAGDVFNYDVHTAWEFDSEFPVRSTFLWYMICGYTFSFLRILRLTGSIYSLDSYWLLVAPRVMMTLISLLTDTASKSCHMLSSCWDHTYMCRPTVYPHLSIRSTTEYHQPGFQPTSH